MTSDLSRSRLEDFLRQHNTMTLATVGPGGQPQAAAVFYAVDRRLDLYFMSSSSCRHSQNLRADPRVAATIQADGQTWQSIRGLQIEGTVEPVTGAGPVAEASRVYVARFDFLRGVLDVVSGRSNNTNSDGIAALRDALASSLFFILRPAWFQLIDNTMGFGHKQEISAEELLRWD